jgi:hypothetical protein
MHAHTCTPGQGDLLCGAKFGVLELALVAVECVERIHPLLEHALVLILFLT